MLRGSRRGELPADESALKVGSPGLLRGILRPGRVLGGGGRAAHPDLLLGPRLDGRLGSPFGEGLDNGRLLDLLLSRLLGGQLRLELPLPCLSGV